MTVSSGNREVADRWDCKRWNDFKDNLNRIYVSNLFQKAHFSSLESINKWNGFTDFIEQCPFTTKEDLAKDRQNNPPYGTNLTFPVSEYKKFNQTSVTQGKPMTWLDTPDDWRWMLGNWDRVLESAGIQQGDRCFFAFSFGPFLGFWTAYESATQRGCICIPAGGQSTEQRLHGIIHQKAQHLFCTPTYAMRLTSVATESGVNLEKNDLKSIIVAGETGGSLPAFRKRMSSAWGKEVNVHDHYGMTEVGPVAYETPGQSGGLRIILDSYFPEVVDPESGQPVEDGVQGELVLTTLGRTGCPVFRYRTGDLVKASYGFDEKGLPAFDLQGGILGRVDDMVVVRGVNLYPSAVNSILGNFPEIIEHQVVFLERNSMLEVQVKIESSEDISLRVEQAFQEAFSLRIPVKKVVTGSLPRHEMKAKRWIKL